MFCVFCVSHKVAAAEEEFIENSIFISKELLRLEEIRLNNQEDFTHGLDDLAKSVDVMSSYQHCHYQFLRGYQKAFKGDYVNTVLELEKLTTICEDLRALIRINSLIANLSAISGGYYKASNYIDKAIQFAEQTNDSNSKEIAYSAASIVYSLLGQHELSVKYSELNYRVTGSDENLCRLQYSKNLFYLNSTQPQIDDSFVADSVESCRKSGNILLAQFIQLDSIIKKLDVEPADITTLNNTKLIIDSLQEEISSSPYKNVQAIFSAVEAKYALLNGDLNLAANQGKIALESNQNLGRTDQMIIALEVLEKVAKEMNDFEGAYGYLELRNLAELEMYDDSQSKQMAFMTVKHSNLAKVFEIEQLNRQKIVLELEKKLARQETNNQRLIILLILTLLGFMSLWLVRIKKKHDYFKDVSEIDHLTKVLTRKAFEEQLNTALSYSKSKNSPVQVAIMDLDFFKSVNDNHGHLIGDWVLKNVIYTCKELVEENMFIGRLGGEEFGVVMHAVNTNQMLEKIEAMRLAIERLDTTASGASLKVTASFGISSTSKSGYDLAMLLTHADLALFKAKNKGRNQTVVYNDNMTSA